MSQDKTKKTFRSSEADSVQTEFQSWIRQVRQNLKILKGESSQDAPIDETPQPLDNIRSHPLIRAVLSEMGGKKCGLDVPVVDETYSSLEPVVVPRNAVVVDPKERTRNEPSTPAIPFSQETFEQAKFLQEKDVRLDVWVALCYEIFTSLLGSDLRRVEIKALNPSDRLETKIKTRINSGSGDRGLSSCKSYAHVVMTNFLKFCFQQQLLSDSSCPSDLTAPSALSQLFDKDTLDRISHLMNKGVRIDLWVRLCYQAYGFCWATKSPRRLWDAEKKEAFEKIRRFVENDSEFKLLSAARLPEFLYSYLYADNRGGVPPGKRPS